jgi:hypothetical protein
LETRAEEVRLFADVMCGLLEMRSTGSTPLAIWASTELGAGRPDRPRSVKRNRVRGLSRLGYDGEVPPAVEIFSATDPVYFAERQVWYWLKFEDHESERRTDWRSVDEEALALCGQHDTCLIDRSDRDSGYLRSTL